MESVFEIIAEPNRRAILSVLVSSQQSVGEIEAQHRSPLHLVGCRGLAHLLRCSGSPSQRNPIGRIVGPEAMKFPGWQRLNAEYAKQFGIETPNGPPKSAQKS